MKNTGGVKKGSKRGSYKRAEMKREQKDITEDGLSYQEIAVILGITAGEVKKIETAALKKLKRPGGINKVLYDYCKIHDRDSERIDI